MADVHYTHCPVCASTVVHPLLTVKDHTVSKKKFAIWQCDACTLRFTQDAPDAATIAPYYRSEAYISHTNTGKGLINRLYQKVRQHTLKQKAALIAASTQKQTGSLLDVGCGTGAFLNTMQSKGWRVTGVEPNSNARELARKLYGLEALEGDQFYALPKSSFDVITMWHVLEHVHELHAYVHQLKVLLKEEGKLFIAVPNYTSIDASLYGTNWAAYDVPRHLYHFTPHAIEVLLEKHGLKVVAKKPMWFDSFYISMLSSRYKNGKTNLPGAFFIGLLSNVKALLKTDRCSSVIYIIERPKN